jgi:hypothetical protein
MACRARQHTARELPYRSTISLRNFAASERDAAKLLASANVCLEGEEARLASR